MKIKIVEMDTGYVALVEEQDDWTGNWKVSVRTVRGEYGEEFIRHNGQRVDVSVEMRDMKTYRVRVDEALRFYKEYSVRV